jgi:uncharacterized protein
MEFVPRFFTLPKQSCFLLGPRGTGKSTWLRRNLPDALFVDLLRPREAREYRARPERLLDVVRAAPVDLPVVVDEIQEVPELLPVIHLLMEEHRSRFFVLTGSSARKLRRAGTNLLGGRALLRTMHPFMAAELADAFSLDEALTRGLLPVAVASPDPEDTLQAYASLYLREEVQAEGLTRNAGNFARFLETVSFSHGSLLNVAAVARECQVERKTVESYVGILEDLLLAWRLPVFTRRTRRSVSSHPKFYFFDTGVFGSLRLAGPLDRPEEIHGAGLEGLVGQHLRAWKDYGPRDCSITFWRTRAGVEVDFVVYGPQDFCAIEVKNTASVRPADLRSLRAFGRDYPESRLLLLYRGNDSLLRDGIHCLPCEQFLRQLRPGAELPGHAR